MKILCTMNEIPLKEAPLLTRCGKMMITFKDNMAVLSSWDSIYMFFVANSLSYSGHAEFDLRPFLS